jgi:predicted CoA-binding protein
MENQPKVLGVLSKEDLAALTEQYGKLDSIQTVVDMVMKSAMRQAREDAAVVKEAIKGQLKEIYAKHGIDSKTHIHIDRENGNIVLCEHEHGMLVLGGGDLSELLAGVAKRDPTELN